ncbi:MAG: R3H domain-containing nucleic acid-binding protein [bacterium]
MADEGTTGALPAEPAERVRVILEQVVGALDVKGEIGVDENDERILGTIDAEDVGLLIGRRGQTIDAVQLLCYRAAFRGLQERKRVVVDAAGYRQRRRDTVERQAERAAERALHTGKEIELEPMTATERKIVHDHLAERSGVETFSEGDEPERCVIVAPLVAE